MCGPDFPAQCRHCGVYYRLDGFAQHGYGCPRVAWPGEKSEFEKQRDAHNEAIAILNQHGDSK